MSEARAPDEMCTPCDGSGSLSRFRPVDSTSRSRLLKRASAPRRTVRFLRPAPGNLRFGRLRQGVRAGRRFRPRRRGHAAGVGIGGQHDRAGVASSVGTPQVWHAAGHVRLGRPSGVVGSCRLRRSADGATELSGGVRVYRAPAGIGERRGVCPTRVRAGVRVCVVGRTGVSVSAQRGRRQLAIAVSGRSGHRGGARARRHYGIVGAVGASGRSGVVGAGHTAADATGHRRMRQLGAHLGARYRQQCVARRGRRCHSGEWHAVRPHRLGAQRGLVPGHGPADRQSVGVGRAGQAGYRVAPRRAALAGGTGRRRCVEASRVAAIQGAVLGRELERHRHVVGGVVRRPDGDAVEGGRGWRMAAGGQRDRSGRTGDSGARGEGAARAGGVGEAAAAAADATGVFHGGGDGHAIGDATHGRRGSRDFGNGLGTASAWRAECGLRTTG
eukprot:ctg_445.g237